jgi:hypothetical protein
MEKNNTKTLFQASPLLNSGKVSELLDPSLGDNYDHEEMERMVLAATLCIKRAPKARPQMSIVSAPLSSLFFIANCSFHVIYNGQEKFLLFSLSFDFIFSFEQWFPRRGDLSP